jgi:hypothetical protein
MKTSKKALILFLVVLAVKDALLGSFLLLNLQWLLDHAGMRYSTDVKTVASFFGVCVLIVSSLCLVAIARVGGNKPAGVFLSKFIGLWMVVAAIIVFRKIGHPQWAAIDFMTGISIVIPAYLFERKSVEAENRVYSLQ